MDLDPKNANNGKYNATARLEEITEIINGFRNYIRPKLETAVNDYLREQTPQTADDKKLITNYLSNLLGTLNFAVERGGESCWIYALSGKKDPHGRFRLQSRSSHSPVASSSKLSDLLPLTLIDAAEQKPVLDAIEATAQSAPTNWRTQVGKERKGREIE